MAVAESIETRQSWIVALAAVTMLALAAGGPMTVVIGLVPIAEEMGTGRSWPSLATSLAYFGTGIGGLLCGLLGMRFGQRLVALLGGAGILLGLTLAALGGPWSLLAGIGLGVGLFGNGALFPPMVAYVSLWFDRRRGSALALVSSGQYIAGVLWPFLFERAMAAHGWRMTMLVYGLGASVMIFALALLVIRPAPVPRATGPGGPDPLPGQRVLGMGSNTALAVISLCAFLCCIPMAMPAAHLVAFCGDLGIAASRGAAMLSVMLLAAFLSRQFWGWLSDRLGGLWTVLLGSAAQTLAMMAFLATQDEAGLFFVAAAYGLGFAGIIPAYVMTVRRYFPAAEAAWRVPALLLVSLSGMAAGAWLAGEIYDRVGFYAAAWWVGIGFNAVQLVIVAALLRRDRQGSIPLPRLQAA
jgi:MFS family permease